MSAEILDRDGTADLPWEIASDAGLRYLSDEEPGWTRRRCGRGFTYVGPTGETVTTEDRERLVALAVPPAWTEVWIAPDPRSHLLATGRDAAGRKQYLYHPEWRVVRDRRKFERLADFAPALERVRRGVVADLRGRDESRRLLATVVRLIDRTLIRVGNHGYTASNGTYGATTLLDEHVHVEGARVVIEYTAKGGKEHEIATVDRLLAGALGRCLEEAEGPLFQIDAETPITSELVNEYVREVGRGPFTAKDFRTWGATVTAARRLVDVDSADDAERDAAVRAALEDAAERLDDTVAVCRDSYVAPALLVAHAAGDLARVWRQTRRGKVLGREERTVARVLDDARRTG